MRFCTVIYLCFALVVLFQANAKSSCAQESILDDLTNEKQTKNSAKEKTEASSKKAVDSGSVDNSTAEKKDVEPGKETAEDADKSQDKNDDEAAGTEEQESESEKKSAIQEFLSSGAIGLLISGGIFMWPILFIGILAVGVIIERYRSLKMLGKDDQEVCDRIQQHLFDDNIEEALELCDSQEGPVPAVLSAGLRKYYVMRKLGYDAARTEEQVVKAMDDYSVHIVAGLERHLPILATVSSAAPMLGFLGTVQGMIVAFQQIVEQMGETNIVEAAASGIQVSLLTTCFGLIVGIPAFVAFNYFTSVINRFVLQVEQSATELIENVSIQLAAAGVEPGTGKET